MRFCYPLKTESLLTSNGQTGVQIPLELIEKCFLWFLPPKKVRFQENEANRDHHGVS